MRVIRGIKGLITGAASGIGRALALRLAREGADLFLVDINEPELEAAADEARKYGVEVYCRPCDISKPTDISSTVQEVLETWGTLDLLVNNAGVCFYGPTSQMTAEQWDWILGVNFLGPIQFVRELLPALLDKPEAHLVNVSSIFGIVATHRCTAYHATKFGILGFTEALRAELSRQGLGVTAVCPGLIRTNLFSSMQCAREDRRQSPPRWMTTTPEVVADRIVTAIYRNQRLVLVTPLAYLLHYAKRIAPGAIDWFQLFGRHKRMKKKAAKLAARDAERQAAALQEALQESINSATEPCPALASGA
jgi:short-subunit dehydrogenase